MRYRTKVVEVEAIRYTGDNAAEVMSICTAASAHSDGKGNEWIEIVDGFKRRLKVYAPALLLCDKRGDWWHSDPEWFENTYEPIPDLIRTVADYEGLPGESILWIEESQIGAMINVSLTKLGNLFFPAGIAREFTAEQLHAQRYVCSVVRLGGGEQ